MAISKELEKISTCCNQIADNVIELRKANMQLQSDVELLKQTVLECQINLAKLTPGNLFLYSHLHELIIFIFYIVNAQQPVEVPTLRRDVAVSSGSKIPKPAPKDLDDTDKLYSRRFKYFLQEWLQDQVTVQLFDLTSVKLRKEDVLEMYKKYIQGLAGVVADKMISLLEAQNSKWALDSYGEVNHQIKHDAIMSLRSMTTTNGIPTDRCTNYWLEDMLIEYCYHNRQQSKKRKVISSQSI